MTTTTDPATLAALVRLLDRHLHQTKAAYQRGTPGVTYADLKAAAERLLTARAMWEQATGRPVRSKPTMGQIATLLR